MAHSSFASAAAGSNSPHNSSRDAASDWSRRTNGATQTFRRPSGATTTPGPQHTDAAAASLPPRYVPPHRNGVQPDHSRYSKDQLLDVYKSQQGANGDLGEGLSGTFVGAWQPDMADANSAGWGRADHGRDNHPGPDLCWDKEGAAEPLNLVDMTDEEREIFTSSVNGPISTTNKSGQQMNGAPGRKISISNSNSASTPGAYGLPSPSVARGGARRRETSESYPFPPNNASFSGGYNREDQRAASPPAALLRRRTDLNPNKQEDKEGDEKSAPTPHGTLKRNSTGPLSAGFNAPSSPWSTGPQSAGSAPMGSFGNFGLGSSANQQAVAGDKRGGLGSGRVESRFKNLLSKDSSEDLGPRTLERKSSMSSLARVNENEIWRGLDRTDQRNEIPDEADEDVPTGSAALAADADISPPHPRQGFRGFGTPSRQGTQDEFGFGAFGMTTDNTHGIGQGYYPGKEGYQQTPAQQRLGQQAGGNEPMSPTDTNPYQSPEQHGLDRMAEDPSDEGQDAPTTQLPGLGQFGGDHHQQLGGLNGLGALPNLGRVLGAQGPASDRSQTSSVGPNRGFPGLGGLGQLGNLSGAAAWPVSQGGLGTPNRQTAGFPNTFGGSAFSNQMPELHSPSLSGLGGPYGGSRLASMFPQGMHDQMRLGDNDGNTERGGQPFGGFVDLGRSAESPFANQGFNHGQEGGEGQFGAPGQHPQQAVGQAQDLPQGQSQAQSQLPGSSASNQPPAPQQRTMVMPDRMRWIYRDPQGQTQGPWTGLEMHDWYKAGFFSPELLVKKYEDPDYEPLAQLIRRIGNSREPFLVPQIGIPHGPASNAPTGWAGAGPVPAATGAPAPTPAGAQPPFASSFPSFGTTLTAEQQNALERRKQEEQYLMARQKEHLAQAQIQQRIQMQGGHPGMGSNQLHHHSSAHSLQSQPSFGSITSPTAYQPSPSQGPIGAAPSGHAQGFFDNSFRSPTAGGLGAVGAGVESLGRIREEDIPGIMDRLNINEHRAAPSQFGAPGQPHNGQQQTQQTPQEAHEKQVQQMLQDRARLQQEQAQHDHRQVNEPQPASNERLQQFQQLQGDNQGIDRFQPTLQKPAGIIAQRPQTQEASTAQSSIGSPIVPTQQHVQQAQEPQSLTEQVQKAVSAKQSPAPQQPGLPQPFPPAPSQSPLPAPAAQRAGRQSVADQLQTESRDRSRTPSADTPSVATAPWAKEPTEAQKGPSLKEIQEAEAKKAAEVEALAVAARRAQFEREMEVQAQAAAASLPGIPTSSTWGAGSPATPTGSAPAAWAKTASKTSGPSASKTLAQIQKEEEARKRRLAAAAAVAQSQAAALSGVAVPPAGKSYAGLAGKVPAPAPINTSTGTWTTVGASGKTKTPAPLSASTPVRTASAALAPPQQAPAVSRKTSTRGSAIATPGSVNAQEEFRKWAVNRLRGDLKGVSPEEFVAQLLVLPHEMDLITEAVHHCSNTIDSRHFAEEFIRRKRLADKGLIEAAKSASPAAGEKSGGGWSEVAKKGPTKETAKEEGAHGNFRVVAAKKKGGKK
ncbi:hypothetical protein DOTSEDRAFT_69371 [Dothistroma septosporum NZE10]|uniref:GYF domain-containing protein n=1 Tax=Dothistroma septosporum (strain NZE10 / CBS 128990) TaxID=675120 RepID=N1PVC0_DOTSN|nr:hypothetical protein DOTSEDRAFT_69371 [Dothistroma septosporum NZE10]